METIGSLETADESSENSGIVKSEDGSPNIGSGRSSPPPNCAICLGRCRNKSFTDSCLHQFCFKCLLTWSKVKTECPLCKQNFKSIIHNVKSNHQYEEYRVQQPQSEDRGPSLDYGAIFNTGRFRYRTTLTLPRRETLAIRQFLLHYPLSALMSELPARSPSRERTRRSPADFRRTVYRHNLWARPLPDFTGRFRDCSPEFFRYNDSQVHRLVPWLSRELLYLLNENSAHVTYVLSRILELLPEHLITSERFHAEMQPYLGENTQHFMHEFYCFAATPYDITGYDRHVQYRTGPPPGAPGVVSEVLSSSDTDSHDSDIMMVSSSHQAGPSRVPPPAPHPAAAAVPVPAYPQPAVIPIETISHSDSDSDSEVMVVGYIKPPHQRTPEMVDLLASDSDVVVQEPDEPAPLPAPPAPHTDQFVRFKFSMNTRPRSPESSDGAARGYTPPPRRRRRARAPSALDETYTPSPTSRLSTDEYGSPEHSSSSSSDTRRKRTVKRRPKKKYTRGRRSRGRAEREPRRAGENDETASGERKPKGKSKNGKDVKSSRAEPSEIPLPPEAARVPTPDRALSSEVVDRSKKKRKLETAPALERAGPSGVEDGSKKKRNTEPALAPEEAGPSGLATGSKRKKSVDTVRAHDRPGTSGVGKSSKKKGSVEPSLTLDQAGTSGVVNDLKTKRSTKPEPAPDRLGARELAKGQENRSDNWAPAQGGDAAAAPRCWIGLEEWMPRQRSTERRTPDRTDFHNLTADSSRNKKVVEHVSRRDSRENKRLKSVVKLIQRDTSAGTDSSGSRAGLAGSDANARRDERAGSDASARRDEHARSDNPHVIAPIRTHTERDYSSSDDNIPLHLAMSKPYTLSRTYVSDFSD